MAKTRRTRILQLVRDNDKKELQFELDFQAALTTQERFEMMFKMSNMLKDLLIKNGHRKPVEIVQRP